jgi:GTP-binding protein
MNALRVSSETNSGARAGQSKGLLGSRVRHVLAGHRIGERPSGAALPCAAVLGRSNVGKSSLLNALLGVKVARVSQTPGRTQALYWYRIDDVFDLVDCPGYGYAKAAKEKRAEFSDMIETLLTKEPQPAVALLLVDSRIPPQASDLSMSAFLDANRLPTVVAATKWDVVKPSQRVRQLRALRQAFAPDGDSDSRSLLPVSSQTGENLRDLARLIHTHLTHPQKESI